MKKTILFVYVLFTLLITVSCRKNLTHISGANASKQEYIINLTIPTDEILKFKNTASASEELFSVRARFKDVRNGNIIDVKGKDRLIKTTLPESDYDVEVVAYIRTTKKGKEVYKPYSTKTSLSSDDLISTISLNSANPFIDLKIEEILFSGTSGTTRDQYVKITNTAQVSIMADGLVLMEGAFVNSQHRVYTPDIIQTAFPVHALYMIPYDSWTEIGPNESITIADQALNHTLDNPNSRDLSEADFEWYDGGFNSIDLDNPYVPNLDKIFCSIPAAWILNNRGLRSFAIGYIPVSTTSYLANYTYAPTFIDFTGLVVTHPTIYSFPNEWIADGINLCPASNWQWNTFHSSIDAGYTGIGSGKGDPNRFDKSVVRKRNNMGELIDTDDSTSDFNYDGQIPTIF